MADHQPSIGSSDCISDCYVADYKIRKEWLYVRSLPASWLSSLLANSNCIDRLSWLSATEVSGACRRMGAILEKLFWNGGKRMKCLYKKRVLTWPSELEEMKRLSKLFYDNSTQKVGRWQWL